jgi:DNA-binding NarL/FixJ family response regulator
MKIKIAVIDGQLLVREGICCLLENSSLFEVVGSAGDGRSAMSIITSRKPDIVLSEIYLPFQNGFDVARNTMPVCPDTSVVLLTENDANILVRLALKNGVRGYYLKTDPFTILRDGLIDVAKRQKRFYSAPRISERIQEIFYEDLHGKSTELSSREIQVLKLYAEGKSTKQVSEMLGISTKTVDSYRSHLKEKCGLKGLESYIQYASMLGLMKLQQVA